MKFTLEIRLGNAAMQRGHDVARALESVASALDSGRASGNIRDLNGNSVGFFLTEEEDEKAGDSDV